MTVGEIRNAECQTASLRKIAEELERANKLKALDMRLRHKEIAEQVDLNGAILSIMQD